MDMSYTTFHIVYDGPALEHSTMDVRDLSPALLALGEAIEEANYALNKNNAKVAVKVRASFKTGCFGIELDVIQSLMEQTLALFNDSGISSAKELVELMGFSSGSVFGLLKLLKTLKGRQPSEIVLLENDQVKVIFDSEHIIIERRVIELFRQYKLRQALEKAVTEQLDKDGIDSVAFKTDDHTAPFITIEKSQRSWYASPSEQDEDLANDTLEQNLQLVTVAFRDDNKWRVTDGQTTFFAVMADEQFLRKVEASEESFAAGDILRVKINKRQWLSKGTMKAEYTILQVLEHRSSATQMKIPFKIE